MQLKDNMRPGLGHTLAIPASKKAEAGISGTQFHLGLCGTLSQLSSQTKEREKRANKYEKILCALYLVPLNDVSFQIVIEH